jgi:PEP-CTERM motif
MTKQLLFSLGVLGVLATAPANAGASVDDLYIVGSNPGGLALDPSGNNIGGIPDITWTQTLTGSGQITLSILAEGIDGVKGIDGGPDAPNGVGELDQVFFNGTFIGDLTQQSFYSTLFNLQPGPGFLPGITAETVSTFNVTSLFISGVNNIEVKVDPGNWVDEIEVSTLAIVPEPSTWFMMLLGFAGLGFAGCRAPKAVSIAA